jgi:hypothetical protein
MKSKQVKCKSGITGTQYKLRTAYKDFDEFLEYCNMWNIHGRLGYKTPEGAWRQNPLVECSVIASDLRKVKTQK